MEHTDDKLIEYVKDFPGETVFDELNYTCEIWPAAENNDKKLKH